MNRDFIIDYSSYILFRILGFFIRNLPKGFVLFLGRRLGDFFYYFDKRHKAIVYSNLKIAFGNKLSPGELNKLTHRFYKTFGQNLIEITFIPIVNKEYLNKYVRIEGLDNIHQGFRKGKGVILLAVHEGSWELSNIICANLGFPFSMVVRIQKRHNRIEKLLNLYRNQKGCKLIQRQNETRALVEALKKNEAIGMTIDQGGKFGMLVEFFEKEASMATGAVRLALRYDAAIIPVFFIRINGPYIKILISKPFQIKKTADTEKDVRENLNILVSIFEKYIKMYPNEYLWIYKIWKYSREKNILILSDGKTGHLRQSQAVANIISDYFKDSGIKTDIQIQEIKFKNMLSRIGLTFSCLLAGRFNCQGCLWCMRRFLKKDTYNSFINQKPGAIISCGSSLASVNYILSRENLSKSVAILRPSFLSTKRFDLVIMPRHDNPPKRKNIVVTEGALNLINEDYLNNCISHIVHHKALADANRISYSNDKQLVIGLLLGGKTKNFNLKKEIIQDLIKQIKSASIKLDADILLSTSRRTPEEINELVKEEFKDYSRCRLLIIANEKNIPDAIGGILGLSQIIIISPESVSMISEAVNSKKYVLVFKAKYLSKKHQRFLDYFAKNKYIYLIETVDLEKNIEEIWLNKPKVHSLRDNILVSEAIRKIL
jgi:KDO2-lipid IV(A) lauroyltransferase